jgi:outer membrane protein, multidrug efflux system
MKRIQRFLKKTYGPRNKGGLLTLLCILTAVTGCMVVGPDYTPPQTGDGLDYWSRSDRAGAHSGSPQLDEWWQKLDDPILTGLINDALAANPDLERARSRVREARARRGMETAARFPMMDAQGAAETTKVGTAPNGELYNAGFDASWELDLFGGVTRRIEAATADLEAITEARRNVRISLLAEVALNYVEYRSLQRRIELAEGNVETQRKTLELVRTRYEGGYGKRLEVDQATTNLETSRARIPPLKTARERAAHRLAVLIGERPGQVADRLAPDKPVPHPPVRLVVGIPADLLRRRPDIRQAERELAAQSARVGVAVADLYPRFTLNGTLQFSTTDFTTLFDDTSRSAGIGPAFSWNIFSGGSIRNNITVQDEKQKQALLHYENTVLQALEEVENAMTAYAHEQQRRQTLEKAGAAAQNNVEQAQMLYKDGVEGFLQVLDAQRVLFDAQDQLAASTAEVTSNLIRLYKALGGGWAEHSITQDKERTNL